MKFLNSEEGKAWRKSSDTAANKRKPDESPVLKQVRKNMKEDSQCKVDPGMRDGGSSFSDTTGESQE